MGKMNALTNSTFFGNAQPMGDAIFRTAFGKNFYKKQSILRDENAQGDGSGYVDKLQQFSDQVEQPRLAQQENEMNSMWNNLIGKNGEKFLSSFGTERSLIQSRGRDSLSGGLHRAAAGAARRGFKSDGTTEMGINRMASQDQAGQMANLTQREMGGRMGLFESFGQKQNAMNNLTSLRRESLMRPYLARIQALQAMPQFGGQSYKNSTALEKYGPLAASVVGGIFTGGASLIGSGIAAGAAAGAAGNAQRQQGYGISQAGMGFGQLIAGGGAASRW